MSRVTHKWFMLHIITGETKEKLNQLAQGSGGGRQIMAGFVW